MGFRIDDFRISGLGLGSASAAFPSGLTYREGKRESERERERERVRAASGERQSGESERERERENGGIAAVKYEAKHSHGKTKRTRRGTTEEKPATGTRDEGGKNPCEPGPQPQLASVPSASAHGKKAERYLSSTDEQ